MKKKQHFPDIQRSGIKKLLLVMKLTSIFIFISVMAMAASTYSQEARFDLKVENASIIQVFDEIERVSEFGFLFKTDQLDLTRKYTFDIKKTDIGKILKEVLNQDEYTYQLIDRNIVITRIDLNTVQDNNSKKVSGKVTDTSGAPLPGVSVVVKGTTTGVITDMDGKYTITNVPENTTLQFSFVGMKNLEIKVGNQTSINVVLAEETIGIEEVVAIGYGTQKKANLTGSVMSVGTDKIANRPITNISSALQGQIAGVTVIQQSGQPGRDNPIVRVRGIGTMNNSDPMVVVDGIVSSMNDLNPNDIESISVLKDASSSAIYGSRAANGVILVTTKRGKVGTPKVTYNGYTGWQKLTDAPKYLDSYNYALLLNEGYGNEGKPARYTQAEIEKFRTGSDPVNYPNTNWLDLLYKGSGFQQSHNISVAGGNEASKYLLSLGYLDQDGLIKNVDNTRYNVRFNLDSKVSELLSIGLTSTFSRQNKFEPTGVADKPGLGELIRQAHRIPSTTLNKYPDGSWARHIDGNPIAWVKDGGISEFIDSHAMGDIFAEMNIIDGLKLRGSAGIDFNIGDQSTHIKEITYGDGTAQRPNSVRDVIGRSSRIILQALLSYNKSIKKHNISALLGVSREAYRFDQNTGYRKDFPNNELSELNGGATLGMTNSGYAYENKLGSYFGRINYNYSGKYLLEVSTRYDGSSKFSENKRWGLFPSFSFGWRISEESFLKDISFIDNLKLRGSYGSVGNNSTSDYQYIPRIELGQIYPFGGIIGSGAAQTVANNPNLQWEKSTTFNIGFDLGLINNKLTVVGDYYDRYTNNILTSIPVSSIYGLPAPMVNAGAMRNQGFDFSVSYNNNVGDFSYSISYNMGFNENKVEKFANPVKGSRIQQEGYEWNAFFGYENIGKYQTDEHLQKAPKVIGTPVKKGDLMFKDQNKDGKIDGDDRVVLGSDMPGIAYGLNLSLKYKNFDIEVFGQGASDVYQVLSNEIEFPFINGGKAQVKHLDRWTLENPNGKFPLTHVDETYNFNTISSFNTVNSSYVRLKNIQLGFTLPKQLLKTLNIDKIRIYVSGQNLLTFSGLDKGFDPESQGDAQFNYPNVKTYTFGANINF